MREYLGFTVIAAIISTAGTIIGLFLKDLVFIKYFDNIKDKKAVNNIFKKYKDPILLSATELYRRLRRIGTGDLQPEKIFTLKNFFNKEESHHKNSANDSHYLKNTAISTAYRFCAFFAWLEIYRQDTTFLHSSSKKQNKDLLDILDQIRECIADGQLNTNDDWEEWGDVLIFREELRAIGEGMIESNSGQKSVIGYNKFQSILETFEKNNHPIWLRPVILFFTDYKYDKEFRLERIKLLNAKLEQLIKCLDNEYFEAHIRVIT